MDFDAIITGIRKAIYGREVREYIASSMEWTRDFVNQSIANIKELLRQAEAARDAAKASQDAAKVSEANAKASENAARASQNAAASSASAAAGSASAAKTSETNAKASENEARQLVEAAKKVVNTDKTLTIDGAPADAKTVGDKFKSIKTDWNSVTDKPSTFPSTWDSVSGKPSSYPPSAHGHYYLADEGDNRSTATTPNSYNNFPNSPHGGIAFRGLKQCSAIGLNIGGEYAYLLGLRGWGDATGGNAHEIAFTDSGIYVRNGSTTSWGSWNKLNTNTITSQTSDPGAGSSLATGSILLVYA